MWATLAEESACSVQAIELPASLQRTHPSSHDDAWGLPLELLRPSFGFLLLLCHVARYWCVSATASWATATCFPLRGRAQAFYANMTRHRR